MNGTPSTHSRNRDGLADSPERRPPGARANSGAGQQERALRTRALILERAAEAFGQDGYEGASLNDIVKATGLTKGAFYHHFSSKDELALAVFRSKQAELLEQIKAEATAQPDALLALAEMFRARARVLTRTPSLGAFLRLALDLVARSGPGSEFAASYELPIGTITELIRRGQAEGVVKQSLDPRAAAEAVFAASLGTDELSKVQAGGGDLEARTARWVAVLCAGLAEAQTASKPPGKAPPQT